MKINTWEEPTMSKRYRGKAKRKRGRPRHFSNGDIAEHEGNMYVVVDHRMRNTKSEYRLVPLTKGYKRFGTAIWRQSYLISVTGLKSNTATVVTYRANKWLEEATPEGRGCACQCCVHEAQPHKAFSVHTGIFREDDDE